ncbi:ParB-like nuclease domain protein [Mycobacterium phage Cepens]|uniref:ParB-like N-terminal domain-containing protein n=1 Tax=Mycobacterium phage Taptic TaxID=1920305 RepID=A0A1J0ME72_9CAUD|nr:hypothetical protein PQB71_gp91 [Mycobacterium phage Taptic]APD19301.1 hypothetical protein SEA_TAPTIC_74 [Mycobacterium phage Taptic]AVO21380.1 hypothetical protein PBI_MEGABEAR_71 [Mycobacterium phage Megabear]QBP31191.1 ParB-like nuclease domain protein [Mycobacterium phage Argie]QBP32733.1 ParB-like nuclease domain protein [Mycobacterium phage Cepens]
MKRHIEVLVLADLKRQELNARFMRGDMFRQLVENLRRDGALTSVPLVRPDGDGHRILSGHHRVAAAIEAGIETAECMVLDEPITRQQEVALVLSHNSLSGEDDPATLKALYEELDDPEWMDYSGLDDRTLELLDEVTTEGLSEANLEFANVNLVFLPHEKEAAERALLEAKKLHGISDAWLAGISQYEQTLAALETVRGSFSIGNVATSLGIILSVFEQHLSELSEGWADENGEPRRKKPVPIETVFGTRMVESAKASAILKATRKAEKAGDLPEGDPWSFMAYLAEAYLASGE